MAEIEQIRVSIKRPKDSLDGKVVGYIRSNPFGLEADYSQVITATLKNHWLPLALFSSGLRGEELRQIGIWAIGQLEAQISVIRRICGIVPDPLVVTSNTSMQASDIVASDSPSILGIISADQQISPTDEDDEVERTAVGLSKDDLRLISALAETTNNNFDALRFLSRKTKTEEINADVELFCRILPVVRKEYCRALWRWLRNIAQMDEILVCGGTASFIRQELTEHFDCEGIPICWNGGMELPKYLDTMGLGDRIADAWASHISHIKFLDHELSYDRQDKPLVPDYYVQPFNSSKPDMEIWQRNGYITTSQ